MNKRVKHVRAALFLVVFAVCVLSFIWRKGQGPNGPLSKMSELPLSQSEAVANAYQQLGMRPSNETIAALTQLKPEETPYFLDDKLSGLKAWKVVIPLDQTQGILEREGFNCHIKGLIIFLAPPTGNIMSVSSTLADPKEMVPRTMSKKEAENILIQAGESYSSLPQSPPSINLSQVLQKLDKEVCPLNTVSELAVRYVTRGKGDFWIVHLYGVEVPPVVPPPVFNKHSELTAEPSIHRAVPTIGFWRCTVNAHTGEILSRDNLP